MAIRLVRDGTLNVFIAGEAYGGALGVVVTALFTMLVGPFWGIKLTALLFYLLFGATLYVFATLVLGRRTALVALLLVSLAPSFLALVGVRERGPHGEALFLGCALMLSSVWVTRDERPSMAGLLVWGVVAGASWYTYYLNVVFLVPCSLYLLIHLLRSTSPKRLAGLVGVAALGTLVGSAPYWFFVFRHGFMPPFQEMAGASDPAAGLRNFFLVGLPIITGGRWPFHGKDLVPLLSKLSYLFYLAGSMIWIGAVAARKEWLRGPRLLVALQLILYPLIFSFSSFYWFADDPRYLIGLYATLPLVAAWLICRIGAGSKVLATLTVSGLLVVSLWGTWTLPRTVFNTIYDEPDDQLIEYLRDEGIHTFYANYWITYRLMFEAVTDFRKPFPLIGATSFGVTRPRYPEYEDAVRRDPDPAFIAWNTEAPPFEEKLRAAGRTFRKVTIGRYVVFSSIEPPLLPEER